jgi:hypothetical protein
VSCSSKKDWAKLKGVLEYLRGPLDEFLTLGANDIVGMMKTWVDASYAVHKDMKSHKGGVVSFIDSLKQSKPTPPQERVGRNILQEIMRNGADRQNTDVPGQTPTKATYADIAKLPVCMSSLRVIGE